MMRVLSVLHFPVFGGPHNRNAVIGRILKNQGVETLLLLPDDAGNAAARVEERGCSTLLMPLARLGRSWSPLTHLRFLQSFRRNVAEIQRIIRENAIDVVLVNGLMNPHAAIAAKRENVSVVWQILDSFPPPAVRRAMRPVLLRYATVVMCTGHKVGREHLGNSISKVPTLPFYPPVELDRFEPCQRTRANARAELGLRESEIVVGNVANVNPMKGHMTFVRAAGAAKKSNPCLRFVIFGQTYGNHRLYAQQLAEAAERAGLRVGTDLQIVDPGTRVAELAQALDIYWLTSEPRSEGISTAAEEAMTLGLPIISTATGSMSEVVHDGENGFMVAPHDVETICRHTLQLANDSTRRSSMGAASRSFALAHFDARQCAARHMEAYELALRGGRAQLNLVGAPR